MTPKPDLDAIGVATTVPDETLRARLLALTADETPVELCYHPDADPGNGAGWSLMVGDRTTYGTLDTLLGEVPRG